MLFALLAAVVLASKPARGVALSVLRFPWVVVQGSLGVVMRLPRLPELSRENADLRHTVATQELELAKLREQVRHVERLDELTVALPQASSAIVASIIGRTTLPTQHVVIVNKGLEQGVKIDSMLVDSAGYVGRVLEVHASTSLAMLVTDPQSRVGCLIERSRELGLLVGTGGSLCQLIHLDLEADVQVDDRIVTAGLGGPFPKGLVVGTVIKVVRNEQEASAWALVRPAVKLRQVEELLCLPPSSSPGP